MHEEATGETVVIDPAVASLAWRRRPRATTISQIWEHAPAPGLCRRQCVDHGGDGMQLTGPAAEAA